MCVYSVTLEVAMDWSKPCADPENFLGRGGGPVSDQDGSDKVLPFQNYSLGNRGVDPYMKSKRFSSNG